MCIETVQKSSKTKMLRTSHMYLLAILFGVFTAYSGLIWLQTFAAITSEIFMNVFKLLSLPIIGLSIIVTIASLPANSEMNRIWQRTVLYTLSTTILAATVACILFYIIKPASIVVPEVQIHNEAVKGGFLKHIVNIVPNNIISPFQEHNVLSILLMGIIIGIAIRYLKDPSDKKVVSSFFRGIHNILLLITTWLIKIMPLGLFGFIAVTVAEIRGGVEIKGLGAYLAVIAFANIIQGFVILPAWLYFNKIKPFKTMYNMLPVLSVAFFSKSSAGTLPITMQTAEEKLNLNPKISRFVLPLCTTINMNGCAAFIFVTVLYVMQNHGIEITATTMAIWVIISTIAAIGNAGVPMGCFFLSASLLAGMNVPITLLGIILPFYNLVDMLETALNVWSDTCVVTVVNKQEQATELWEASQLLQ